MKREKISGKPATMIRYLQEKIYSGEFAAGEKLPPMRELMEKFGFSYNSAKRAIDYLGEQGLVEIRPGCGTFVVRKKEIPARKSSRQLSVFLSSQFNISSKGIYVATYMGVQEAAVNAGYSLNIHSLDRASATSEEIVSMCENSEGCIFLGEYDKSLTDIPLKNPGVGVCMHRSLSCNLSLIDIDPFESVRLAAEYFKRKKKKQVIVMTSDFPAYRLRADVFRMVWEGLGCKATIVDKVKTFNPKEGYLFTTGSMADGASKIFFNKNGLFLCDKVAMISIDGKNRIDPDFHPGSTIGIDWRMAGKAAFDECIYRICNPGIPPRQVYIAGRLYEYSV